MKFLRIFAALILSFTFLFAGSQALTIKSSDGFQMKGWLTLPQKAKGPAPLALLVHEFGSDHRMWDQWVQRLNDMGYATFTPDLRAHGASSMKGDKKILLSVEDFGKPHPEAALEKVPEDLKAWMELLEERKELDLESPLLIGSSLGGGALIPLLLDYEAKAVITLSPAAPKKPYAKDSAEAVENSDAPWLIVSSQRDFAKKASLDYATKALRPTLLVLPGSGHGSKLLPASDGYLQLFLKNYLKTP